MNAPHAWTLGHEPVARPQHPGAEAPVVGVVALLLVCAMLASARFGRAISTTVQDLWNVRPRGNAFDPATPGRRRLGLLMALQWVVMCGILLYTAVAPRPGAGGLAALGLTVGLMGAYYAFQVCAYATVAYAFAPDAAAGARWMEGFRASQGLCGVLLAVPALCVVFYPHLAAASLWAACGVYALARLAFIIKGFRIFYTSAGSLIYFILYLCTLEIIPLLAVYGAAGLIAYYTTPVT